MATEVERRREEQLNQPAPGGVSVAGAVSTAGGVAAAGVCAAAIGDADECFRQYLGWLLSAVRFQLGAELQVERLLDTLVVTLLKTKDMTSPLPFRGWRFGSRHYGVVLPSSDLDIVFEVPRHGDPSSPPIRVADFLGCMLALIRTPSVHQ